VPEQPDYIVPEERRPVACPLSVYGNNAAVACPCGRVIVVRSMNAPGTGAWQCSCSRWYKGWPEDGQTITHILVWEADNQASSPSYRIKVEAQSQ
jgi:hypothetical protein